jgi:hypothetical protein
MEPVSCAGCQALQRRLRDLQAENERLHRRLRDAVRTRTRPLTPAEEQLRARVKELAHERAEHDCRIQSLKLDAAALRADKTVLEREVKVLAQMFAVQAVGGKQVVWKQYSREW